LKNTVIPFMRLIPALLAGILLILVTTMTLGGAQRRARALHDEPTPSPVPAEERRARQMQALEADIGPPLLLEPLSAVPCEDGFADIYPCSNVDLLSHLPLAEIGGGNGNDIWGWTDPLDGKEYALMGRSSGTSFVDISDPLNPVYLGNLPTQTSNSSWRDIKVYNNHAFVVSEASAHGMQVFDLTLLRSVVNPPVTFTATAHYNGFGNSHNIAINEDTGFAYAVGTNTCSGGLHMIDISNPLSPTFAGCYTGVGYTHDTQCVIYHGPDVEHQGKEICFNSNETTVAIVDVTNKAAPVLLSNTTYQGVGYTHQGWLTEDHANFLLGDELDELNGGHNTRTYLWNLDNLEAPFVIDTYTATTAAIDHNMYIKGNYVYQSNYRAGLRILDISGVAAGVLEEVGFFDIYPANDNPNFNGSWSNYPYFDSGVVIVSGIEQGLFVVQPRLALDFALQVTPESASVCVPDEALYTVDVLIALEDLDPVMLSAIGNPDGTTVDFSVNPVVPPGTSTLTIGNTAGAMTGSYEIEIVGESVASTHTIMVGLHLFTSNPGAVALSTPPDGALEVAMSPTLVWEAAAQAESYTVEIASDAGFGALVYAATVQATSHAVAARLEPESTYYWRVRAENACGAGENSPVFSFTTRALPPILLVDDDDDSPDVLPYFSAALDSLGYTYDVFDVGGGTGDGPTFEEMAGYPVVIWFSGGKSGNAAGPNAVDEASLSAYLEAGGNLFLSSQDYLKGSGLTTFGSQYLGIGSYSNDAGNATVKYGVAGDPLGDGAGPYPLSYPVGFSDQGDIVNPGNGASTAFRSSAAGGFSLDIDKDGDTWKTVFFGTSWVPVYHADSANGIELLQRIIDWFIYVPTASIELVKTVGSEAGVCAATTSISVPAGTEVTYCFEVTNNGDVTLVAHDLVDSELGVLLDGFAFELEPGASTTITATATVDTGTVNHATWTAYGEADGVHAEASASAEVLVYAEEKVYLPILRKQ
jgi:choice-of-anchor B domain-containing protein